MEKLNPSPSPKIKDGKIAGFYPSLGFILDLAGGGGEWGFAVPFYSVQDCSLGCTVLNYNYLQAHFSKVPVITEPGRLFCLHLRLFFISFEGNTAR